MNKAFVREPDLGGKAYCPQCGSEGVPVSAAPMDRYIRPEARQRLGETAWFCSFARCEVAYFDTLEVVVNVAELTEPIYPKDATAFICPCFQFSWDDVQADVREGTPTRIRALLVKSQSAEARCRSLAPDGKSCIREVQRLFMKLRGSQ
jgi:hypothetical protein